MGARLFLSSIVFLISTIAAAQSIKEYVYNNAVKIESISPDSTDFKDFEVIGEAIKDARIVMLGEQDHGDAATFLAKTRLIKYLHEKKGFNVLAFESDFFSLYHEWNNDLAFADKLSSYIKENIGQQWSKCKECSDLLFSYIPNTIRQGNPLVVNGIDNQVSTLKFIPSLDSLITALKIPISANPDFYTKIFPEIKEWYRYYKDSVSNRRIRDNLKIIKQQVSDSLGGSAFWVQAIETFIAMVYQYLELPTNNYLHQMNTRDTAMSDNLRWLSEVKYPKEKIIVWAHNYHVSKYAGHYPDKFLNVAQTMGSIYTSNSRLENQTYVIGFSSFRGTAGRIGVGFKKYKITNIKKESFESWLADKYEFAFVDFKPFEKENRSKQTLFYMSGATLGNRYHDSQNGEWTKIFNGVFFIKDMYPCTIVE